MEEGPASVLQTIADGFAVAWAWLVGAWGRVAAWWGTVPPVPDLDLPPVFDWPVVVVIATTLLAISLTAVVSAWVERRTSWFGWLVLLIAAGLFFWVWEADRSVTWTVVPEGFVEIVARILR
ncbi:hypothetical protein JQC91_02805 [Jannaschia sp. Os4]|uniref:hypothetical protein n=1 Tax=Jannaschia sp. Os4 TaxID=2807617 RepID=UPI00193A7B84|nr:hypothetical protein [Jannaschia sp. Os4]MBM2575225.1 hypothetical protein [Jannaschia sp. Os4]